MFERDIPNSRQTEINRDGSIFTFPNTATIAAGSYYSVDVKEQTLFRNALDYAPFDALSIANTSDSNILVYINTVSPTTTSQVLIVPRLSNQTYDLTKIRSFCIKNNDSSNTIGIGEIYPSLIRNAYNVDRLSEDLAGKFAILGNSARFGNRKTF